MDILVYAAKKNISDLNTCINTYVPTTFYNGCFEAAKISGNDGDSWTANSALYSGYQKQNNSNCLWVQPYCAATWSSIPTLPGGTECTAGTNPATSVEYSGFKVCATNFSAGATCTWTVPAGATIARFQLWGAGGRSGSGCCCGGSTWGSNGAYASIIIPVTAGCQYTLTAACGCRTPILWQSVNPTRATATSVTGEGLCNLCAMSGLDAAHWCIMAYDIGATYFFSGCCRWTATDCFNGGSCICNGQNDFCFTSSCASCGCIPASCSNTTRFYGCSPLALNSNPITKMYGTHVAGLPGLNGGMCYDTGFNGIATSAPVYGYNKLCSTHTLSFCGSGNNTGGLCCNHIGYDYRRYPGAGGTSVHMFGGCTATCDPSGNIAQCGGDIGRSGMVCVTYA
jgi:hypothetical protein